MNGFAHLLYLIDVNILELERMQPLIAALIRFGDLTLIFGFIGLFLILTNRDLIKWLSLGFSVIGVLRFFLIEFSLIDVFSLISFLLLVVQISFLIMFVLKISEQNRTSIAHKGYLVIGLTILYCISILILMFMANQPQTLNESILAVFYIGFQLGLWMFFKQWYKERTISM